MAYENVIFEISGSTCIITFNRPKALNALNSALLNEFSDALDRIERDETIRVMVLTGAGDKSFVAGADISELVTFNPLQAKLFAEKGQRLLQRLQEIPIPVIAAVNGFALGGGTEMALACDFIYASEDATFGLPEINLSIIPGFGGTQRLSRLVGLNRAKELVFTGKMVTATEALTMGIVNQLCASDVLMETVMETAEIIGSKGRIALRAAKQVINSGFNGDLAAGFHMEADAFSVCMTSEDSAEGMRAFMEKRKAEFKGGLSG